MSAQAGVRPTASSAGGSRRLLGLIGRPVAGRLAGAVLLGAGAAFCAVALIATSAWLISRSAQRPQESALALAIVGVQFFALARGLLRYCERLAAHDAALRALAGLRVRIYDQLERLAPAGLPAFRSGDLLARLVHDVDSLQDLLVRVLPPFAIAISVGAATALFLGLILPAAGLGVAVALLLAGGAVPRLTGALAARTAAAQARARGELSAEVVDLLAGAAELEVAGAMDGMLARARALDAELTRAARAAAWTAGAGQGLISALMGLAMWGSLALGVAAVAGGRMDGILLAGLALVPLAAVELVSGLPTAAQAMQSVRRSGARVERVLDAEPPVPDPAVPAPLPAGPHAISISGLRCRYPGRPGWALAGVDLELAAGSRVAVAGPSGAGKTTLAWALLRFLPYSGSIRLDGTELDRLAGEQVRRVVGLVEQDAHIFDSTIEANLHLARPAAEEAELLDALARVRLLEWTRSLPAGLATAVGERGVRLSGGQRQRLRLARALLADVPVLILDEPSEHLDPDTAAAVIGELLRSRGGRSTLLMTHRLAGLESFDEIVFLDRGAVAERGTHPELLAAGGRYARLWHEQDRQRALPGADVPLVPG
jgi:ATP-binding cassette subfamily C protein CydC